MAAVVTLTEENISTVKKIKWEWTAHTDGKVAKATINAATVKPYSGEIIRMVTIPDAVSVPTAAYDVYVYDGDDTDALMAGGLNRSATATEQVAAANLGIVANDNLTLYVENAGNGAKGTVILYVR